MYRISSGFDSPDLGECRLQSSKIGFFPDLQVPSSIAHRKQFFGEFSGQVEYLHVLPTPSEAD